MNRIILLAAIALSACTQSPSSVRITNDVPQEPVAVAPKPMKAARSEPVFYNGKTYKLNMNPTERGIYSVEVIGMSAAQQKEAKAFTTSAFHHYNCKDSQRSHFITQPAFQNGTWQMQMSCG
jgi:hypothetical protein